MFSPFPVFRFRQKHSTDPPLPIPLPHRGEGTLKQQGETGDLMVARFYFAPHLSESGLMANSLDLSPLSVEGT
jgi:hypothetical protein